MPRYFLELAYKGTAYSGFQTQHNTGQTIQAMVEAAFLTLQRQPVTLTGSSRTDAGVHALQNFFHFDYAGELHPQFLYKINAILPRDIVIKSLREVPDTSHCRFDAVSRRYKYFIYRDKNPFLEDRAYYYPYRLDLEAMQAAAAIVREYNDFTSFSKRNTQVKTFQCTIFTSQWAAEEGSLVYEVKGNRFLRGMVRALTGTMLLVGRGSTTLDGFRQIIEAKDCTKANFGVPARGLFLAEVAF